jgi:hypothetical protein
MTWDVLQNAAGELQMVQHGLPVPDGWVMVVETADPDYLVYMASLTAG